MAKGASGRKFGFVLKLCPFRGWANYLLKKIAAQASIWINNGIPYSGKVLRVLIFAGFADQGETVKLFTSNF